MSILSEYAKPCTQHHKTKDLYCLDCTAFYCVDCSTHSTHTHLDEQEFNDVMLFEVKKGLCDQELKCYSDILTAITNSINTTMDRVKDTIRHGEELTTRFL